MNFDLKTEMIKAKKQTKLKKQNEIKKIKTKLKKQS